MDITIRNMDEKSFRRFKAKCAESGTTLGDALSELMSRHSPSRKEKTDSSHKLTDFSEHLRKLGNASSRARSVSSSKVSRSSGLKRKKR